MNFESRSKQQTINEKPQSREIREHRKSHLKSQTRTDQPAAPLRESRVSRPAALASQMQCVRKASWRVDLARAEQQFSKSSEKTAFGFAGGRPARTLRMGAHAGDDSFQRHWTLSRFTFARAGNAEDLIASVDSRKSAIVAHFEENQTNQTEPPYYGFLNRR